MRLLRSRHEWPSISCNHQLEEVGPWIQRKLVKVAKKAKSEKVLLKEAKLRLATAALLVVAEKTCQGNDDGDNNDEEIDTEDEGEGEAIYDFI